MKISIIYHSESGNTKHIAEAMEDACTEFPDVEMKAFDISSVDVDFASSSKALIFGCPTYSGSLSWQMKKYLDTCNLCLNGKLGSAFATERYIGGGADAAELAILGCLLVRGMVIYTGGAQEAPATHFGAVSIQNGSEEQIERSKAFVKKIVVKAQELFGA